MTFLVLKHLHITLALISISGFIVRYLGKRIGAAFISWRLVKILPHLIDTLLLASGIGLAWIYRLSPLAANWFTLKLVLIVVYILLGALAMRAVQRRSGDLYAIAGLLSVVLVVYLAVFKPF